MHYSKMTIFRNKVTSVYVYVYICTCASIHVFTYVYLHMCVYIYLSMKRRWLIVQEMIVKHLKPVVSQLGALFTCPLNH